MQANTRCGFGSGTRVGLTCANIFGPGGSGRSCSSKGVAATSGQAGGRAQVRGVTLSCLSDFNVGTKVGCASCRSRDRRRFAGGSGGGRADRFRAADKRAVSH